LRVVSEFPTAEPKTKLMRKALSSIAIKRSVLLVDNSANKIGIVEPQTSKA